VQTLKKHYTTICKVTNSLTGPVAPLSLTLRFLRAKTYEPLPWKITQDSIDLFILIAMRRTPSDGAICHRTRYLVSLCTLNYVIRTWNAGKGSGFTAKDTPAPHSAYLEWVTIRECVIIRPSLLTTIILHYLPLSLSTANDQCQLLSNQFFGQVCMVLSLRKTPFCCSLFQLAYWRQL